MIRERGDQDARGAAAPACRGTTALVRARAADADRRPIEQPPRAVGLRRRTLWYGLSLGSVLLLAAIGLAITFGVMGVINMAHGEMVMLGAYTTFVVQEIIRTSAPGAVRLFAGHRPAARVPRRGRRRHRHRARASSASSTAARSKRCSPPGASSLILQQAVRTAFGPTNHEVGNAVVDVRRLRTRRHHDHLEPPLDHRASRSRRLRRVAAGLLRFTRLGLEMRAVTQNRSMAASMGIRTRAHRRAHLRSRLRHRRASRASRSRRSTTCRPNLGQGYIIDSFLVVVFGGVGNLWGTLVGALTLGIANKFLEPYAGAVLGKIAILVLIILFIQKRPRGLFALKGRAVEA